MPARGCGESRILGGVYLECPLSNHGLPLEAFLRDPPDLIDPQSLGITPIGIKLIEVNGVYHVFDWVGSNYYPNVADFVEEVRRMGLSRRIAKTADFSKITHESRIILIHERAYIHNWREYGANCEGCISIDPKVRKSHTNNQQEMCARTWWEDIEGGEGEGRAVVRRMPSFEYFGRRKPEGVKPDYGVAIFASFPIPRIVVVNDPEGASHEDAMEKAKAAGVPVRLVNE